MADILSSLWQALSGGGQQVQALPPLSPSGQNVPNQPTMPTMQQPSGIAGVLANPAVQGALASYFAGISSPRQMGWGGAIGRAGLAGLGQYGQAAAQQAELPYRQAMTQKTMAEAQQEQAKAQALGNLTGPAALAAYAPDASKYLSIQSTNNAVAQQLLASHKEPFAANVAQSIASDTSKPWTLTEAEGLIKAHTMAPLEEKAKEAEIASTEAGTLQKKAEALKAQADAELDPVRKQALLANAQKAEAQAKFLGQAKPMTAGEIERAAIQAGRAAQAAVKQGTLESKDAFQKRSQKAYDDAVAAERDRLKQQQETARSVAAAPDLPEGWTEGEPDAEGRPTAVDPSGVSHTFVGD